MKLKSNKFDILANPFGVIYNPLSVLDLIDMSINREMPPADSYLENHSVCYNYFFHSDISALSEGELDEKASSAINLVHEHLKKVRWILITMGTAFIYRRKDNNQVVANCHKMPDSFFRRELLEPEDIMKAFEETYVHILAFNPQVRFIFTVSPVRHIRDSLPQNSVSKAILRYAIDKLTRKFERTDYFPSYELFMDDLRDYRFYAPDMLHPNEVSENYVWGKFIGRYLDEPSIAFIREWEKISRAMAHKPFYPDSPAYQDFLKNTLNKLYGLQHKVDVSVEIEMVRRQLNNHNR